MRHGGAPTDLRTTPAGPAAPEPPARSRRWLRWWPAWVALALICAALVVLNLRVTSRPATSEADVNGIVEERVGAAIEALQAQPPASVTVYQAIVPPLVVIETQRSGGGPGSGSGVGSGVIVNTEGDILTSLHVVEGAASIKVSYSDGTESPAAIRSADAAHDIAVLRPARLPEVVVPAVLGGGAQIGEEVFAVGHPLGLVGSLSAGVVSGLDRNFPLANGRSIGGMIQFDAAVNPGNSGGPLLNRNGQVIGIVTGLANPGGDDEFIGIGFAVPIGTAGGAAGGAGAMSLVTAGNGEQPNASIEQVLYQVKRIIVGQDILLERMIVALLAKGHLLVEGVPGLAKTLAVKAMADALGVEFQRIQFTPDLVPADIVGTRIYNQKAGEFQVSLGPIFANLVLADEINRAPAKVQSALLEAMQERQVTIGRQTHPLPDPFLVMATQNPIESDGTYPLPEAQVDRFMLKVLVDYPTGTEEFVIVERMIAGFEAIQSVMDAEQLSALQKTARDVYVDPSLIEYAVRVSNATRNLPAVGLKEMEPYVTYGVSPRASIYMVLSAQALALVRGRDYTLPDDILALARDVLRHRIVLSYEALGDDVTADDVLDAILARIPMPQGVSEERRAPVDEGAWAPPPR